MATYSTTNQESIQLFQFKDSSNSGADFNHTLVTVGANEMYELMAASFIAQDGTVTAITLYGDYSSVVDNPVDFGGNSGQGVAGYINSIDILSAQIISSELLTIGADTSGYTVTNLTSPAVPSDQASQFLKLVDSSKAVKFYQGSSVKLKIKGLSGFTPSSQEFVDTNIWLKKTVFAG